MLTRLKTAPTLEPVTLTEVKLHLRLAVTSAEAALYTTEDTLLGALIEAARTYVETYTSRALITQVWYAYLQAWPTTIQLPYPPLDTVDAITAEGVAFTDYEASLGGLVRPTWGNLWPTLETDAAPDSIVVEFTAGYGATTATVPRPLRQAILLLVGHWYGQREESLVGVSVTQIPVGVTALLAPYRWMSHG